MANAGSRRWPGRSARGCRRSGRLWCNADGQEQRRPRSPDRRRRRGAIWRTLAVGDGPVDRQEEAEEAGDSVATLMAKNNAARVARIVAAGEALYGERWQSAMARSIGKRRPKKRATLLQR